MTTMIIGDQGAEEEKAFIHIACVERLKATLEPMAETPQTAQSLSSLTIYIKQFQVPSRSAVVEKGSRECTAYAVDPLLVWNLQD